LQQERLDCPAVNNFRKKPIIGILGGIGSGKSTVAAEFAKLGCRIIDADNIARELLGREAVREKIVGLFGESILDSADKINRKKLAEIAFADVDKLSSLNSILHPLVLARAEQLIEQYKRQSQVKAIVLDIQISLDKKASISDNTINNNSDLLVLTKQVTDIFSYITDDG